jgi:hypothetical protein
MGAPALYLDFWGWSNDPSGEESYVKSMVSQLGGSSWLATVEQYGGGNSTGIYKGSWDDPSAIPSQPSTDDIEAEALSAAIHFNVVNNNDVYIVVATPTGHSTPGFGVPGTGFCAYHTYVGSQPNVSYVNFPYQTDAGSACGQGTVNSPGTLDGVSEVLGHELGEGIVDPVLNGWYDHTGYDGGEIADKCVDPSLRRNVTLRSGGVFAMEPLWSNGSGGCVTSSAFSAGYYSAFQASNGLLWVTTPSGTTNTGLGMAPNTSPAITPLVGGGYEVLFEANGGMLWRYGTYGPNGSTGNAMAANSSPAIAPLTGGGYAGLYQASSGYMWKYGTLSGFNGNTSLAMAASTSPSITQLPSNGYEALFQSGTGIMWKWGTGGGGTTSLGMADKSSPTISSLPPSSGWVGLFQANTGYMWKYGSIANYSGNTNLGMAPNTSPTITGLANNGYEAVFQAYAGVLWMWGTARNVQTVFPMAAGTSPAITWLHDDVYQTALQSTGQGLWIGQVVPDYSGLGMAQKTSPSL